MTNVVAVTFWDSLFLFPGKECRMTTSFPSGNTWQTRCRIGFLGHKIALLFFVLSYWSAKVTWFNGELMRGVMP